MVACPVVRWVGRPTGSKNGLAGPCSKINDLIDYGLCQIQYFILATFSLFWTKIFILKWTGAR